MTEIYSKNDLNLALHSLLEDDGSKQLLAVHLIKVKLGRLKKDYKELKKIYDKYEPIIIRNLKKDVSEYDIHYVEVDKINKNSKKLEKVINSISFYTTLIEDINENELSDKRRTLLTKLVNKNIPYKK